MRYYRTTGLMLTQMQELVCRVAAALPDSWAKKLGRPRSCGLYQAVEIACMYIRHNCPQEFLGDLRYLPARGLADNHEAGAGREGRSGGVRPGGAGRDRTGQGQGLPGKCSSSACSTGIEIVGSSGGGVGDKGYQGTELVAPRKKPKGGEFSRKDKKCNAEVSALPAPVERVIVMRMELVAACSSSSHFM